jgi:PGF-pre-PGF domain-containing protein
VGGATAINSVEVLGTGHNELIVTGAQAYDPGTDFASAPGTVYQYVDLDPARYSTIDQAVIAFTVPNAWLEDNQISPQNVVAYRDNGVTWTVLPTTFVETDGSLSRYTAVTPSLATRFAITGQSYPVTASVTYAQIIYYTAAPTVTAPQVTHAPQAAPTQPLQVQGSPAPFWVPVLAVLGALMALAVCSGRKGKNS